MWRILAALGHPERRLPPVIHVAGTNGKGSTIAFMRAILEAAGLRVHVYTSPHLVRFNERFRLGAPGGGRLVADDELADALDECERANGDAPITVFEIKTAAAFLLFARHPADVLLLEVGLGGRLDATNVIERPLATRDHAGLARSCRISRRHHRRDRRREGRHPQARRAGDRGAHSRARRSPSSSARPRGSAPLRIAGEDWTATEERGRLVYQDDDGLLDLPAPKLFGRHQFENAGIAIAALRAVSGLKLPPRRSRPASPRPTGRRACSGSRTARSPRCVPAGGELWLDGGHNADGGRAIAAALADLEERVSRPLVLVVGMLSTKDSAGLSAAISPASRAASSRCRSRIRTKSLPAEAIAEMARAVGIPAERRDDLESALAAIARFELDPPPRILITGSLYLAGEVLRRTARRRVDLLPNAKRPALRPAVS